MNRLKIVLIYLLFLPASSLLALDAQQLLQEVDGRLQPESYEMYRKLINIEPDG